MEASKVKNDSFSNNVILGYNMEIGWFNRLTQKERANLFLKGFDNKDHIDF